MQLCYSPTSPYARKVLVAVRESGLETRIELTSVNPWDASSGIGEQNPLAKIPVLILDDGTPLFDSPVICEYLDSLLSGTRLIPPIGPKRWTVLRLQALADGVMDAALLLFLERSRRQPEERSAWWQQLQLETIRSAVEALEPLTASFSEPPDIGQIATGCALGYLDFRITDLDWRPTAPQLTDWFRRFSLRPSMQSSAPDSST